MKANEILTVLNDFKDTSYKKVLIDGDWGIGKTKYVEDFKQKYSDSCYISLFGKKDIQSIIQEIYYRIIENVPLKKYTSVMRERLNNLNFRFSGFSISIPIIEDLHKTLHKELGKKQTFIIIFDDLERKHDNLSIKEIFGLIDSLSKIKNIKTVLVAATDQMGETDKEIFGKYREKAIDRTYSIKEYAEEAPVEILGKQIWEVIGILTREFKFNNLRTFEKTSLFIKEVTSTIGEEHFTEKFTKGDLYRMCFSTVFYNIEHNSEMKLLETNGQTNSLRNISYQTGEEGVISYLNNYILKNSLDNTLCKNIFPHIKNWYETGAYNKEIIISLIDSINRHERKPENFFSSEKELISLIDHTKEFIRNLNGTETIEDIIMRLSTALIWCEVLSIDFGISNKEVLELVTAHSSKKQLDINKTMYENEIRLSNFHIESKAAQEIMQSVNNDLRMSYYKQLLKKVEISFNQSSYGEYIYLRRLNDSIRSISKYKEIRDYILNSLRENNFFFPIPSGSIKVEQWWWCHEITELINEIKNCWEETELYDELKIMIRQSETYKSDSMAQHRTEALFENK